MKKINKLDLIEIVAEEAHLSKKDAAAAVSVTFETMKANLLNNIEISVSTFGSFTPITKQSRKGTDPSSHKQITIAQKKSVSFKPSRIFKEELNK
jgi:nucleoid DNA-binding protein